jgi:hypothetical protein
MARNGFRGAFHGPHPAQARPAQILKRNQEEVRADRALLLADAEWVEDLDHAGGVPAPYKVIPVNLAKGEQFKLEFLSISSNNRMTVMVDADGPGGRSISIRVGCNPAISGTQDGSFLSARRARPRRGRSVAVLADGRDRTSTSSQTSSGGSSACRRVPPSITRYIFGSKRRRSRHAGSDSSRDPVLTSAAQRHW